MKKPLRTAVTVSLIALPIALYSVTTTAQTTTTATPTDPAVLAAQNQQAIADAQLKIQQDQQAALTGLLPASSATPNSGAFTVTGSTPFPSQKLAYAQLQAIARSLASDDDFKNVSGPVVLYDSGEVNNLLNYNALIATLTLLDGQAIALNATYSPLNTKAKALQQLNPSADSRKDFAPMLVPGLILGGLKTATDIIGMFRTNTSVAYNSFTPDDIALVAAVSKELLAANDKRPVYIPAQMPLSLNVPYLSSTFMTDLNAVQKSLFDLQTTISQDQANLQQLSGALGAYIAADQAAQSNTDQYNAETDAAKKAALKTKQASLDRVTKAAQRYVLTLYQTNDINTIDPATANVNKAVIDQLVNRIALVYTAVSAASTGFSTVQTSLVSVSASGTSSLAAILRAEALLSKVNTTGAVILSVKTSVLGGAVVTRQNLFTGGHLLYTGGAIVNFVVFNSSGTLLHSGVLVSDDATKYVKY